MLGLERRVLRSRLAGWGIRGLLVGFLLPGHALLFLFLLALRFHMPLPTDVDSPVVEMAVSDPELRWALRGGIHGDDILVVGSSEMGAVEGGTPLSEMVNACRLPGRQRRVRSLAVGGSAILRAAALLERLRPGAVPHSVVILANPHYAARGAELLPPFRMYFPDDASLAHFAVSRPDSPMSQVPEFAFAMTGAGNPLLRWSPHLHRGMLEIQMFRHRLTARVVQPLRYGLFAPPSRPADRLRPLRHNAVWGVDASQVPLPGELAHVRERRTLSAGTPGTDYYTHLRLLRSASSALPDHVRLDLVLLPLNEAYYRRLGLNAGEERQRWLAAVRRELSGIEALHIVDAQSWAAAGDFFDAVHWHETGRRHVAESLCAHLKAF